MQWNVQGIRSKKDEIAELIERYKATMLVAQETKLTQYMEYKIPNDTVLGGEGTYNYTPHGGVAICVHSSVPYSTVELNIPIQDVAVKVQFHKTVTICNIYSPRSQVLDHQLLENIYLQLLQLVIMLSDFNTYNTLWRQRLLMREVEKLSILSITTA